jgi:hypothetical protein
MSGVHKSGGSTGVQRSNIYCHSRAGGGRLQYTDGRDGASQQWASRFFAFEWNGLETL